MSIDSPKIDYDLEGLTSNIISKIPGPVAASGRMIPVDYDASGKKPVLRVL
jgi:hypothetical protein